MSSQSLMTHAGPCFQTVLEMNASWGKGPGYGGKVTGSPFVSNEGAWDEERKEQVQQSILRTA